jgi:hypothetical protein
MQTDAYPIFENHARYVEVIRARAPRGLAEAVKRAAKDNRLSSSEFIRRALAGAIERLTTDGLASVEDGRVRALARPDPSCSGSMPPARKDQ